MKWFERTGGYWLFWWSAVYFVIGMLDLFVFKTDWFPLTQLAWLCIIALPLVCNPLARWLNMKENTMFDWMKKNKMPANVVPFPAPKVVAPVEPPAPKEKDPAIHYTIGHTDDNRVAFKLGYSTLMMNYYGVQTLIDQLELYQEQLHKEEDA
jgi:hypothetical protein